MIAEGPKVEAQRRHAVISVSAAVVVGIFMLTVAWRMRGPTVHPDEFGFLLNGQIFLGHHEAVVPTGSFYPVGYGVVTAIGAALLGGISGAYRFALFFNLACASAVAGLVFVLARRVFQLPTYVAIIGSCLVFVAPGTVVSSAYAWPETAARMMALVWVLMLARVAMSMNSRLMISIGLLVGILPVLHGRFTLFIPITFLFFAWWFITKQCSRWVLGTSSALVFVSYFISYTLNTFVKTLVYTTSYDQENRLLLRLLKPELWTALIRTTAGQTWYLLATSAGLVGVAVIFMVVNLVAPSAQKKARDPQYVAMMAILLGTISILFTGGLQLLYGRRADHLIYGRYVEVMVPALWLVGIVALYKAHRFVMRVWPVSVVAFVGISLLSQVIDGVDRVKDGYQLNTLVFPNTVGIDAMSKFVTPGFISLSIAFAIVTAVVCVMYLKRGAWAMTLLVLLLSAGSVLSAQDSLLPRGDYLEAAGVSRDVALLPGVEEIGFDKGISNDALYYFLRYKLHPVRLTYFDASSPEVQIDSSYECIYGWRERQPAQGSWEVVAEEPGFQRVLFRRVGSTHC
jgi:hypothetical protein